MPTTCPTLSALSERSITSRITECRHALFSCRVLSTREIAWAYLGVQGNSRRTEGYRRKRVPVVILSFRSHPERKKTLEIGGYNETLAHAEDADLWWRIALAHDIEIIPEVLVGYRQHEGQATTQAVRQNSIDLLYVQYLLISKLWNRVPLTKEEVRLLLERFVSAQQVTAKLKLRQVNIRAANRDLMGAIASGIGVVCLPKAGMGSHLR